MSSDPRFHGTVKRLKQIPKVYMVLSSKGGVGKSIVSTLLSYYSSLKNTPTGLLDLDFTNPSTHIILGFRPEELSYREEKGLEPYKIGKLSYFSIISFTKDNPLVLKGEEARNVMREVLSIVNWVGVQKLFIDTPPGLSDEQLEAIYNLKGLVKPIVVSTPHKLSIQSVSRLVRILRDARVDEIILVENMGSGELKTFADSEGLKYAGYIPFVENIEECIGSISKLENCRIREYFEAILIKI